MSETIAELKASIARSIALLPASELPGLPIWDNLYEMEPILPGLVASVLAIGPEADEAERQKRGELLERAALALISGVRAVTGNMRSFQGPVGQFDLIANTSHTTDSPMLQSVLFGLKFDVLLEAKATSGPVDTSTMSRLCAMLVTPYGTTKQIGIFLSLAGITGGTSVRKASDAQLMRMLFHADSKKPVLVIDRADLERLAQGENLLELLHKKIEELESGRALEAVEIGSTKAGPLPPHLQETFSQCRASTRPPPAQSEPAEPDDAEG